jgi:hypothetical protein
MKPHIDTLFKSKLEHYATPAPQHAWDRIEAGLNTLTEKRFWLKIAAGLLLFAITTWLVVNYFPEEEPLAQHVQAEPKSHFDMPEPNGTHPLPNKNLSPVKAQGKPLRRIVKIVTKSGTAKVQSVAVYEIPTEVIESVAVNSNAEEGITQPATGLVIVLTAEEVNAKYLVKTSAEEATPEQKKSSRLQKLAVLAHNLSNEDILGDLRERKNELFAFNFLDNKEKKN